MEERPLSRENFCHVGAHRLGEGENQDKEHCNLQKSVGCHVRLLLEALRLEERENQVEKQEKRRDSG